MNEEEIILFIREVAKIEPNELELKYHNQLSKLPPEIGQLTSLTWLDLSHNQLSQLPPEIGQLTNLTRLDLSYNQLSQLPPEIGQLTHLTTLYLDNNPLTSPPLEIASRGIKAIRNYFASLESKSRLLSEVKVLLVGEGNSGKTSLVKRLLGEAFDKNEPTTHGIRISGWAVTAQSKAIKVNLWDFGGQQIMHATHQFFLSQRCLYLLVLDGRRDERPEYWLQHIQSFGGNSPILVVLNKHDENPSFKVNSRFLQEKYPGIQGFYPTSCATDYGLDAFKAALMQELTQLKMVETRWPNSWFKVKQQLESLPDHYISYKRFAKICARAGVKKAISQEVLIDFLHDLGVMLHFREFQLEDTHVLEPKWVTEAVYKIVTSDWLAATKGVLRLRHLSEILQKKGPADYNYPRDKFKYIISIMQKFELCYDLDAETVLLPQLLDVVEPTFDFDYDGSLKFILSYEFLPPSVMPRFIVNRHKEIKGNLRWRTGVVLEHKFFQSIAVIKADEEARRINIYVNGQQRQDYFITILFFFQTIHNSFEKLKVRGLIPMPDNPEITVTYQHLLWLDSNGKDAYSPDGAEREYKVRELLDLIQPDRTTEPELLEIMRRIESKINDPGKPPDESSLLEQLNKMVELKPNVAGVGLNVNAMIEMLLARRKK